MLTLFFTFLFSFLFAFVSASHAQLQTRSVPVSGQFEVLGEFDYLNTSANFPNGGGSSTSLPGGAKYSKMEGRGQVTVDFSEQLRTYAGFSGGQASADVVNATASTPTSLTTDNHTISGLNEIWAGSQWWIERGDFDLVPQFDLVYPLGRVDKGATDTLLGEGALRLQGGGMIRYNLAPVIAYGYLGYAYRDEGRSPLLPYVVGLQYTPSKMLWLELEFRGYQSVADDSNTGNGSVRQLFLSRTDGGSYQYDSLNPSQAEVALSGGLQFGNFGVYAGVSASAFGRASADALTMLAGLTFSGSVKAARPKDEEYFNSKPESYDERLFRETTVPTRPPPAREPEPVEPIKNRRRPPPRISAPTPQKPAAQVRRPRPAPAPAPKSGEDGLSVDLLMKQTEKSLEKKK